MKMRIFQPCDLRAAIEVSEILMGASSKKNRTTDSQSVKSGAMPDAPAN